jgi:hypothetical protein
MRSDVARAWRGGGEDARDGRTGVDETRVGCWLGPGSVKTASLCVFSYYAKSRWLTGAWLGGLFKQNSRGEARRNGYRGQYSRY